MTGCLSYLKILHYKVIQDSFFLYIMTGIRAFLQKWHNTVILLTVLAKVIVKLNDAYHGMLAVVLGA